VAEITCIAWTSVIHPVNPVVDEVTNVRKFTRINPFRVDRLGKKKVIPCGSRIELTDLESDHWPIPSEPAIKNTPPVEKDHLELVVVVFIRNFDSTRDPHVSGPWSGGDRHCM